MLNKEKLIEFIKSLTNEEAARIMAVLGAKK